MIRYAVSSLLFTSVIFSPLIYAAVAYADADITPLPLILCCRRRYTLRATLTLADAADVASLRATCLLFAITLPVYCCRRLPLSYMMPRLPLMLPRLIFAARYAISRCRCLPLCRLLLYDLRQSPRRDGDIMTGCYAIRAPCFSVFAALIQRYAVRFVAFACHHDAAPLITRRHIMLLLMMISRCRAIA